MQGLETIVEENAPKKKPTRRPPALRVVTTSEIQTFRSCGMLHHFQYRERLRTKTVGKALAIGKIFHAGMSAGLRAGFAPTAWLSTVEHRVQTQIDAATARLEEDFMTWAASQVEHGQDVRLDKLHDEAVDGVEMVRWMLSHYFSTTRLDLSELRLVETENRFSVNVRNKLGHRSPLTFDGVRDAVFYDPRANALVLHEHKTVSNAPSDIGKRAELDPQTCGYVYSLRQAPEPFWYVADDGTSRTVPVDATVGRVAYNAVRKKKPSTPKINLDGTVSAAQIDTLAGVYRDALEDQVRRGKPVTDKQAAILAGLEARTDSYMYRHEFHRGDHEVERWRSDTFVDASRMRVADRDPAQRTRNPGNCTMPWSLPCSYRGVCIDDTPEMRAAYRVADTAHEEVREAEEELAAEAGAYVAPF